MQWPTCYFDMNKIEHISGILGRRVPTSITNSPRTGMSFTVDVGQNILVSLNSFIDSMSPTEKIL